MIRVGRCGTTQQSAADAGVVTYGSGTSVTSSTRESSWRWEKPNHEATWNLSKGNRFWRVVGTLCGHHGPHPARKSRNLGVGARPLYQAQGRGASGSQAT